MCSTSANPPQEESPMNSVSLISGRFRADQRGSVAIVVGLMSFTLLLCVGGAIDFARWYNVRTVTRSALDAAVLAGGRQLQLDTSNPQGAINIAKQTYIANTKSRLQLAS